MNSYLVKLLGKIIGLVTCLIVISFVSISLFYKPKDVSFQNITVNNSDIYKESKLESIAVKYDTIIKYNPKMPISNKRILIPGQNGFVYKDNDGNIVRTLKEKTDEVIEVGTAKPGEYNGVLTLYGPDCATCDGHGYVYCPVAGNKYHSLIKDGMYYEDKEYGKVRILSAALAEFPCGTIIEINNKNLTKEIGIVLDTGSGMKKAYNEGWILIDLAHETEKNLPAYGTTHNTSFSVKRWGW